MVQKSKEMTANHLGSMGKESLAWQVKSKLDLEAEEDRDRWPGAEESLCRWSERKAAREED